jgi:NTE family protein
MADAGTALVLSAGGLYCAYQAGAYRAIAKYLQPDVVVGASAGALNGWPIAAGCPPELLIERWLDRQTSDVLRIRRNPGLRRGYFDAHPLRARAEAIACEFQPRVPFGVALVEFPRLRTTLVQHPRLTARHLEATCAIPLLLPPVVISGTRYVDGGLLEKAPLWGAIRMGATRIIAIDCMPDFDIWWLRIGAGVVRALRPAPRYPAHVSITVIRPSEPLGHTRSAFVWKRGNIERWIDLGYRDATCVMENLAAEPYLPASGISK